MDESHLRAGERVKMKTVIKEIGKKVVGILPSKMWLSFRFKQRVGYKMDWKNPKTFNQKLQWLKLNDHKDEYTRMVDKYEAKKYVAERIGEEYIIKTLGVWDNFDDIDFSKLPNQFVLKCTHNSGGLAIVKDKNNVDFKMIGKKFKKALKQNPYTVDREWPYKNVKPRIIAEVYMSDDCISESLIVYKFFCFNGVPRIIQTIQNDKKSNESIDYFDVQWKKLELRQNYPNSEQALAKPEQLNEMITVAEKLSKNKKGFIRVDLYQVKGKVYFSEFTFFSDSGLAKFHPFKYDELFGSWIDLNFIK